MLAIPKSDYSKGPSVLFFKAINTQEETKINVKNINRV